MQTQAEIKRVRDGLVADLWDTVATDGNTEHTELLARIDTLNWVLESAEDPEPQTVEGPAMTMFDLLKEVDEPEQPVDQQPVQARSTLADTDGPDQSPSPDAPPTVWETIAGRLKQGTDAVLHATNTLTPTEIIDLTKLHARE